MNAGSSYIRWSRFACAWRRVRGILLAGLGLTIAAAVAPARAYAQTTVGTIRGFVRDAGGKPVADAQIAARSVDMGITRSATTNSDGFYSLSGLRPGTYQLTSRRIGYAPEGRTIPLQIGQTLDENFVVTTNPTQLETVVITGSGAAERKTSEVATNVTQAQINDLPSPSRNILDLAALAPGVHVTPDRIDATSKEFSAGAQPAEQINIFVDGASYKNDIVNGGVAGQDASRGNPFPRSAVQEFRVATSQFKAEYQKASSAIITAVTKSGTNDWEGSTFVDYQTKNYVSLDYFQQAAKDSGRTVTIPDYRRSLFGLSGGGPIVENKLFFFGSYEGNDQVRQGVTRLGGSPSTWPVAIASVNGQANDAPFTSNLLFGKLTWNASERHLLELSADARLEGDKRDFAGQSAPQDYAYSTGDDFHSNVVTGRLKETFFTGAGTNEALLSLQGYRWHNQSFDFNTPALDYAGIGRIGGHDAEQDLQQRRYSLRDDFTFSARQAAGTHIPKIGMNVDVDRYTMTKALNDNPTFFFDPSNNFQTPVRATIGVGDPTIATDNTQVGLYAQDDWNPTSRLTFNLGVRWDYESAMFNRGYVTPQAVRDSITAYASQSFVPIDPNRYFTDGSQRKPFYGAIQPRVGASYALDESGRTTVFGGWGIFYDRLEYNATLDEQYRRQHQTYNFIFGNGAGQIPWNPSLFSRAGLLNAIASGSAPPQEVYLIPNDLKPPNAHQWSAGLRHDFGSWNSSLTYNNTRSFNGFTFDWANVTFVPNQGRNCCFTHNVPAYQNVLVGNNTVRTWYDAVQIQLDRPYRRSSANRGWGAGVAWTISKADAEGGDLFSFPQLSLNPKHPTANDELHHIVANAITDVPYLWGMQLSGLLTLGSGLPFDKNISSATQGAITEFGASRPKGKYWFFAFRELDLRLGKDFLNLGGNRMRLTLDIFNVFNDQNFGCFNTGYGSISATGLVTRDTTYGRPNCTVSDPRRLQIGAAYDFGARPVAGLRHEQ